MAHLPPVTWNDVATKENLAALETTLRSDLHAMGADMRTLETSLRSEMHVGFADLRTGIVDGANRQIKWMITFAVAWSSLLFAAVRLIP